MPVATPDVALVALLLQLRDARQQHAAHGDQVPARLDPQREAGIRQP